MPLSYYYIKSVSSNDLKMTIISFMAIISGTMYRPREDVIVTGLSERVVCTHYFSQQDHIFPSDHEDPSGDVSEFFTHVDPFHRLVQNQVGCWRTENNDKAQDANKFCILLKIFFLKFVSSEQKWLTRASLWFLCCFNHSEIKSSLFTRTPNQTLLKDERRHLLERFQVPLGSSDYNSDGVSVEHDGVVFTDKATRRRFCVRV